MEGPQIAPQFREGQIEDEKDMEVEFCFPQLESRVRDFSEICGCRAEYTN